MHSLLWGRSQYAKTKWTHICVHLIHHHTTLEDIFRIMNFLASTSPSLPSTPSPEPAGEPTPEKERGPVHIPDLVLSPIQGQRDDDMPSPTLFLCNQIVKRRGNVWYGKRGPKCEMTFNSESELRTHGHKDHYYCFQHETQYDIVCPAPGVPSHRCVSQMLTYCRCKCDCLCGTE